MATALEPDEVTFSPEAYRLEVPSLDGFPAARCALRFSGTGNLDRTSSSDVELMRAARLGSEVLFLVRGEVSSKSYSLKPGAEELEYHFAVRITAVEAAETA